MPLDKAFADVAIALGLGLLVGLQRQHSASSLAGIRTFPLLTLLGTVAAYLARFYGGLVLAAALLGLALVLGVSKAVLLRSGEAEKGATTDAGALLMFALGAYVVDGNHAVAIALGAVVAALLEFKGELHGFTERLGDADVRAIMQFAVLSLVVLPVLPDRTYGPYDVLNPRHIWLMVVLIVGISLGGYIAHKLVGGGRGTLLSGLLGGLISSTATTVAYARRTRRAGGGEGASAAGPASAVVLVASGVAFARVLVEVAVVSKDLFRAAAVPLLLVLLALLLGGALAILRDRDRAGDPSRPGNPTELRTALSFGLLYAGILLLTAAVRDRFGARALYAVAAIAGLTDVDAISLSTSRLVEAGQVAADDGWRVVLTALLANLVFKGVLVGVLGSARLLGRIAAGFGLAVALGTAFVLLWPE